jgi:hypothetical protein
VTAEMRSGISASVPGVCQGMHNTIRASVGLGDGVGPCGGGTVMVDLSTLRRAARHSALYNNVGRGLQPVLKGRLA